MDVLFVVRVGEIEEIGLKVELEVEVVGLEVETDIEVCVGIRTGKVDSGRLTLLLGKTVTVTLGRPWPRPCRWMR